MPKGNHARELKNKIKAQISAMEDMLNEAVKDMSDLGVEDDDINNILTSPKNADDLAETDDTFAELDAMLNDADKELNELLNS